MTGWLWLLVVAGGIFAATRPVVVDFFADVFGARRTRRNGGTWVRSHYRNGRRVRGHARRRR